jgi:hypothetical protein
MNVTENISKQIAPSFKNLTILSTVNYTVLEEDPVILWMMNLSPNQQIDITYSLSGDLGNSNLFKEPVLSEARISKAGGGGGKGEDMTWLIAGVVVIAIIAAIVVLYLFFLKPRGIKIPLKYSAFVKQEKKGGGVLDTLKGIPAKLTSVFKKEKKEIPVSEKKSILYRLPFRKKASVEEEPKQKEKIEAGKPKPTKEELIKKLSEVYKK